MQQIYARVSDQVTCLELPAENAELMPGVRWGAADELFTPAFWKAQAWQQIAAGGYADLRLGRSLAEEASACLLGGYGMPAELGLAAFARLQDRGLLNAGTCERDLLRALSEPLLVHGRARAYRFARQKAHYLAKLLAYLHALDEPHGDVDLRDALTGAPGVGPKTASWVVRNYRASDRVAILDVHIMRACALVELFPTQPVTASSYRRLETAFLNFADALQVRAGMLDGMIWDYMRRLNGPVRRAPVQLTLF